MKIVSYGPASNGRNRVRSDSIPIPHRILHHLHHMYITPRYGPHTQR